eukprot:420663-Prymnesium_polylepis.1
MHAMEMNVTQKPTIVTTNDKPLERASWIEANSVQLDIYETTYWKDSDIGRWMAPDSQSKLDKHMRKGPSWTPVILHPLLSDIDSDDQATHTPRANVWLRFTFQGIRSSMATFLGSPPREWGGP